MGARQTGNANRSQIFGPNQAILDWASSGHYNRFNRSKYAFAPLIRPTAMAGNFYEKVLQWLVSVDFLTSQMILVI